MWGYSSAGRALEWHSRGQRFDPAYLHHTRTCGFPQVLFLILLLPHIVRLQWRRYTVEENIHAGEEAMTDFQYKQIIEMICQIIKANIAAGKSSEEILEIIAALKGDSED